MSGVQRRPSGHQQCMASHGETSGRLLPAVTGMATACFRSFVEQLAALLSQLLPSAVAGSWAVQCPGVAEGASCVAAAPDAGAAGTAAAAEQAHVCSTAASVVLVARHNS